MFQSLKARFSARSDHQDDRLNTCDDLPRLDRLRRYARDRTVRQRADARYRALLVGGNASLRLETRVAAVRDCTDTAVLAYVARSAREECLRREAVERLGSDRVLMEVALNDSVVRLRRRAVALMNDPVLLEDVVSRCQTGERRIARDAAQRLRELADCA
ncbi:hypothetical protein [Aquisalimonas sp.]|uniref:hypothetical protein n=1 Tax=unclassified Aquisalimonas TaxID=2644645 RepID=UPI0025C51F83|nr:hypothetical protein [Aquisalimonas sp.]